MRHISEHINTMKTAKKITLNAILCILVSITCSTVYAQSGIVSGGGTAKTEQGTISCSIGQIVFTQKTSNIGSIQEGLQQPESSVNILNINNINNDLHISASPNPTKDICRISMQSDKNYQYIITTITGKTIEEGTLTNNSELHFQHYLNGIYLLQIKINEKEYTSIKIIKE